MSRRLVLGCDKCGSETPNVKTVSFTFDGVDYQTELCKSCLSEVNAFHKSLTGKAVRAQAGSIPARDISGESERIVATVGQERRGRGRPKGSKNKPKASGEPVVSPALFSINDSSESGKTFKPVPRKIGGGKTTGKPAVDAPNPAVVRQWARDQGLDMPERGRLPATLIAKFQEAGSPTPA